MFKNLSRPGTLAAVGAVAASLLSGPALAQNHDQTGVQPNDTPITAVEHQKAPIAIQSVSDFIGRWNPSEPLYVNGREIASAQELAGLRSWIKEHNDSVGTHWTVMVVEKSYSYEYAQGFLNTKKGADGYIAEIHDNFVEQTNFSALTDRATGEKNGAMLFVSLDHDGTNRKMILWTKDLYENNGVGCHSSVFLSEIFPHATSIIRDQNNVCDGIKYVIGTLDNQLAYEQKNGSHMTSNEKLVLYSCLVGAGILGIVILSAAASKRTGGSSSSSFFSSCSSASSCGGSSCGGGGCGGGGGF